VSTKILRETQESLRRRINAGIAGDEIFAFRWVFWVYDAENARCFMNWKETCIAIAWFLAFPAVILAAEYWHRREELCYWQGWRDLFCTLGGAVLRFVAGCALLALALLIAREIWRSLPGAVD